MLEHRRSIGPAIDLEYDATTTTDLSAQSGVTNWDHKGNKFRLFVGVASTVKGSLVQLGAGTRATALSTTTTMAVGTGVRGFVSCSINIASQYGWYLEDYDEDADAKFGMVSAGAITALAVVQTTATGGQIDDAAAVDLLGVHVRVDPGSGTYWTDVAWHGIHPITTA